MPIGNNRYRYFYDKAEYAAFLAGKAKKSSPADFVSNLSGMKLSDLKKQEKIKETMRANKVYDRALSDLSEKQIKTGKVLVDKTTKASLKDVKTYDKYGIAIDRDAEYRVTGISASNVDMRKLKRIKKIQRKVARNGDC